MASFPNFASFPAEIQDLIWFHAVNNGPSIQFFYSQEPHGAMSLHSDMDLIPDRRAAVLNLLSLSLACTASHAAVLKKFKTLENPTILRHSYRRPPSMSLRFDLGIDVVCSGKYGIPFEWAEYSHIIFMSTRRFGVRCSTLWQRADLSVLLCDHSDQWIPHYRLRACTRCIRLAAILLRKFRRLQCLYLILDTPLDWGLLVGSYGKPCLLHPGETSVVSEREVFHACQDAYFEVTAAQQLCGEGQSTSLSSLLGIANELVSEKHTVLYTLG